MRCFFTENFIKKLPGNLAVSLILRERERD
jgi:hypothetical protein